MSKKIKILIKESGCGDHSAPGTRDMPTKSSPCASNAPYPKSPYRHKNTHNNEEARMHRTTLAHLLADVKVLLDLVEDQDDLPEWLEAKITKAGDYMSSAARYIAGNVARDHGQLEEQESNEKEMLEPMLDQVKNDLGTLSADQIKSLIAVLSPIVSKPITEGMVGLTEEILIESHYSLYDFLQDAVDENGNRPCPQCLYEVLSEASCGCPDLIPEAKYRGRKVKLNKPTRGDVKKFKVYVKNAKGKVVKVNFGHGGSSAKKKGEKTMKIRKSNKKARKSFRARHKCKTPGPKWKARYWSCRKW